MTRPVDETRQDRRRQHIVGLGVVLIFALSFGNIITGVIQYNSQTQHHDSTVKQQKEILSLLQTVHNAQKTNVGTITDIKALETEVAAVIAGLPKANTTLITVAEGISQQLMAICVSTNAHCPPLPAIPTGK